MLFRGPLLLIFNEIFTEVCEELQWLPAILVNWLFLQIMRADVGKQYCHLANCHSVFRICMFLGHFEAVLLLYIRFPSDVASFVLEDPPEKTLQLGHYVTHESPTPNAWKQNTICSQFNLS